MATAASRSRRWQYPVTAWNAGEFSPHLYGRFDLEKYISGAETILNFIIQPEGGVKKRSGTRYVKALQDSSVTARFIPFMYGTDTPYMLEFGLNYIRFYRNEAPVLETAKAITAITAANPAVVTKVAHAYENGEEIYIDTGGDMTEVNGRFFTVANKTDDTFELSGEDASGHTAYTTGGTVARVYTVTTTYTQAEVVVLEYAQSSDTLYLAHNAHAPAQLTRIAHTSWTLADVVFVDGPYLPENQTGNRLVNDALTGAGVNIVADTTENINGGTGFVAGDVGRFLRLRHEKGATDTYDYGYAEITTVTDSKTLVVTVINDFINEAPLDADEGREWRLGAFFTDNYPAAVSFGDGRLWWGGVPDKPGAVYSSKSGEFLVYAPSTWKADVTADDAAVSYTIGVSQVSNIIWISSGRAIMLGTPGGVFPLQASSNSEPITPTNINVPSPTQVRAAAIHPVIVGDTIIFVNRAQNQVRGMKFALDSDGFLPADLTRFSDHIGDSKITQIAYAQDPDSVIWCVRTDGVLGTMTHIEEEDIAAWSRQILGGSFGSGDAVVESVAAVESPNADHDQVWMLVKRTINGSTVRHVEFLEEEFSSTADITDAYFVDCGVTYDDTATTTITGLGHLEGESVDVLADGAPAAPATVTGGQITLATAASKVHVGYSYNSDLGTLKLSAPSAGGTSQGLLTAINAVILRMYRSMGGKYGPDSDTLTPIVHRTPLDAMDTPVPLFSGDEKLTMEPGRDRDPRIFIRADQPIPFNLLSLTALGTGGNR